MLQTCCVSLFVLLTNAPFFCESSMENGMEEKEGVVGWCGDGRRRFLLHQIEQEAAVAVERSAREDRGSESQASGGSGSCRPFACGRCSF